MLFLLLKEQLLQFLGVGDGYGKLGEKRWSTGSEDEMKSDIVACDAVVC